MIPSFDRAIILSIRKTCRLPKQALFISAMGKDQLKDLDGQITMRISDGIAWDFTQAK